MDDLYQPLDDDECGGYMRGVALAANRWELDTRDRRELSAPILAFQGERVSQTQDLYNDEEVRALHEAVPVGVRRIHSYRSSKRAPVGSQVASAPNTVVGMPKVGRNDPCPCGSGKKFKSCHGRV